MTTTEIAGTFVPNPSGQVVSADIEDEAVLLHEGTGQLHSLNPTAAITWKCFDGTSTVDEIVADLVAVFEVGDDEVRGPVLDLVARMVDAGLLVEGHSLDVAGTGDGPAGEVREGRHDGAISPPRPPGP